MVENIPAWINIAFIGITIFCLAIFYLANGKPKAVTLCIIIWSVIHSILAYLGFYENTIAMPTRFALILIPSSLLIVYSLLNSKKNIFLQKRNMNYSTFLHVLRLPVEIILHKLFILGLIPIIMTYKGINFDIIMGITAPIIALMIYKNRIHKKALLAWNILGLILISTILIVGVLSSELPFQVFGLEQANRAVTYFPFVLLPATIVPIVLFTHLSDILILINDIKK